MITIHPSSKVATVNKRPAGAAAGRHDPSLLTETEIDRVAAAGSKPGGTGDGHGLLRIPGEAR